VGFIWVCVFILFYLSLKYLKMVREDLSKWSNQFVLFEEINKYKTFHSLFVGKKVGIASLACVGLFIR
jgi:hypothetical protein